MVNMKDIIKSEIKEAFGGCTTMDVIKRIIGMIIAIISIFVCCGAESLGFGKTALCLGICILLWKFLGISKAFREDSSDNED